MHTLVIETRASLRRWMRAKPLFFGIVAMLAIGIGLSSTVFSLVAITTTPVSGIFDANRVVELRPAQGRAELVEWQQVREDLAEVTTSTAVWLPPVSTLVRSRGELFRVGAARIGPGFLDVLKVTPVPFGRPRAGGGGAFISHAFWLHLGGPSELAFDIDTDSYEMVGVLPAEFSGVRLAGRVDVWLVVDDRFLATRRATSLIARLRAREDIGRLGAMIAAEPSVTALPLSTVEPSSAERLGQLALLATSNAIALAVTSLLGVLLLMLARLTSRAAELAVRLSLGSSNRQLIFTLLTDTAVAVLPGIALGGLVAFWARYVVASGFSPEALDRVPVRIDSVTVIACAAAALVWCAAVSAGFSLFGSRLLVGLSGRKTLSPVHFGLQRQVVLAQVFLAMMLLTSSAGMHRVLNRSLSTDAGVAASDIVVATVDVPARTMAGPDLGALSVRAAAELRSAPGVAAVAVTSSLPLSSIVAETFQVGGRTYDLEVQYVSPEYFDAMSITVIPAGRGGRLDAESAVVNETLADRVLAGGRVGGDVASWSGERLHIVGMALDGRYGTLQMPIGPKVYRDITTAFRSRLVESTPSQRLFFLVRPEGHFRTAALGASLRATLPASVLRGAQPLSSHLARSLISERLVRYLGILVTLVAVSIALAGGYSMIAADLAATRSDLALHVALGATSAHLARVAGWRLGGLAAVSGFAGLAVSYIIGAAVDLQLAEHLATPRGGELAAAATLLTLCSMAATAAQVRLAKRADLSHLLRGN